MIISGDHDVSYAFLVHYSAMRCFLLSFQMPYFAVLGCARCAPDALFGKLNFAPGAVFDNSGSVSGAFSVQEVDPSGGRGNLPSRLTLVAP